MLVTKFQNVSYNANNIFVKDIYQIFQYFYDPLYLYGNVNNILSSVFTFRTLSIISLLIYSLVYFHAKQYRWPEIFLAHKRRVGIPIRGTILISGSRIN